MADFAPLFHSADLVGQGGQACVLAPKGSQSAFKVRAGPTSCEPPPARPPAHCPTRLPSLSLRPSPQVSQVTSCLEDHVRQVGFEAGLAARLGQHGMAVPIATWLTWAVPRDVLGAQWGQDTQQPCLIAIQEMQLIRGSTLSALCRIVSGEGGRRGQLGSPSTGPAAAAGRTPSDTSDPCNCTRHVVASQPSCPDPCPTASPP